MKRRTAAEAARVNGGAMCYRMGADRRLLNGDCPPAGCKPVRLNGGVSGVPDVPPCLMGGQHHTVVDVEGVRRVAMMVNPDPAGSVRDQVWEAVSTVRAILRQQGQPMAVTVQTVFVRDAAVVPVARQLFEAYYGDEMPVTLFVEQAPCDGRALAIEAWAIGTTEAEVRFHEPNLVSIAYGGLEWTYAGASVSWVGTAFDQATEVFEAMDEKLASCDVGYENVARVWLYQGGITEDEDGVERYRELNRARTAFFGGVQFEDNVLTAGSGHAIYPASTGIGTARNGLASVSLALRTERQDVQLVALENPLQTSSFDYPKRYSEKSPKFSRAMAVCAPEYVTTWVSGTASIVDSETVHVGDIVGQTEQTLTNIENLIAEENFRRAGVEGAGATLADLAKIRVYVKRPEDYEACRAICEARLGAIPAVYASAEVCRPDLLVEIEGVAFSPRHENGSQGFGA